MNIPLGEKVPYPTHFDPSLLCALPRRTITSPLQSQLLGHDVWNCYEMSWCDVHGVPQVGIAQFEIDCQTPFLIESKSLKLFLGSLYNEKFDSINKLQHTIKKYLSAALKSEKITVNVFSNDEWKRFLPKEARGICVDTGLEEEPESSSGLLHSNLLRSLCPVTGQPDLASVEIAYRGRPIAPHSFRKLLLDMRDHQGFHEAICEEIVEKFLHHFGCEELTVLCSFTRRGGIDINPLRYLPGSASLPYQRLIRQ